jgi:hypothetical protein
MMAVAAWADYRELVEKQKNNWLVTRALYVVQNLSITWQADFSQVDILVFHEDN